MHFQPQKNQRQITSRRISYFLVSLLLTLPLIHFGQDGQISPINPGLPLSLQFSPKQYDGHRQNWCIAQDESGVIYVGNTTRLLAYDGVKWRSYNSPNGTVIRSLAKDVNGTIYYGAKGDFGYLKTTKTGLLELVSITDRMPDSLKNFKDIWNILCTDGNVFFQTNNYIFQFNLELLSSSEPITQLKSNGFYHIESERGHIYSASLVKDQILFYENEKGLYSVLDGKKTLLAEDELPSRTLVYRMISIDESNDLIVTARGGFYLFDGKNISPFEVDQDVSAFLKSTSVSNLIIMEDEVLAVSSYGKGILLMDKKGQKIKIIDKGSGTIPSNNITNLFVDNQHGLWASTENGIARIDYPSPFSILSATQGLDGNVYAITRHQDQLFVGTNTNLYRFSPQAGFTSVKGIQYPSFSLLSTKEGLLVATSKGIFLITDHGTKHISTNISYLLKPSVYNPDLIYIGLGSLNQGFAFLRRNGSTWDLVQPDTPVEAQIRFIAEEAPGIVWLGSAARGYFRLEIPSFPSLINSSTFSPNSSIAINIENIPSPKGRSRLSQVKDKVFFGTNQGLKYFDYQENKLKPALDFGEKLADSTSIVAGMTTNPDGKIWIKGNVSKNTISTLEPTKDQGFMLENNRFMNRFPGVFFNNFYFDESQPNLTWFGGSGQILRYDASVKKNYQSDFPTLIRSVRMIKNADSLVYYGSKTNISDALVRPTLKYEKNSLRFEYAAPHFDLPEKNTYQVFLEGFDSQWSDWTDETQKDYTNLSEGTYTFKVRAKNIYEYEGGLGSYSFSILPPWYRTWWAYLLYISLGISAIYFLLKWRSDQLRKENQRLEAIIAERTKELAVKNQQLETMDQAKSRLFTNISHEFRTPLTIIDGIASQIEEKPEKWLDKGVEMIRRNSQNLLSLVNQILELRKLESGTLQVNLTNGNIIAYIKYLVESFHSLAESKDIDLLFISDNEELSMDYDAKSWQHILSNLIANAVKFTEPGGEVSCQIRTTSVEEKRVLQIEITDNGKGISPDALAHIFDRFYQVDNSSTRTAEGTGIGLALVKELVNLLHGQIKVESRVGEGTRFELTFPINNQLISEHSDEFIGQKPFISSFIENQPSDALTIPASHLDLPKVLIIEDNPDLVTYLISCLEGQYEVIITRNGQEGIDKALEIIPDLIISDVMMPIKDGFEVCNALKNDERTSHIPIILLTAKADIESKIEGLTRGAEAYLTKPFNKKELLIRIETLLEIREKLHTRYRSLEPLPPTEDLSVKIEDTFILKLKKIILNNIDNQEFKINNLCLEIGISRSVLHTKLKALTGLSTSHYIRSIRLQKANELLANPNLSISEITYLTGFNDPAYFSRVYLNEFGRRPSEVRN